MCLDNKLNRMCLFSSLQLAEAAKSQFSRDYSDHLALVRAYDGWKDAEIDNSGYEYCWRNFLSAQSMKAIDSLRKEFFSLLKDTGLVDGNTASYNTWSHDDYLIRAVICYGLYPGICSVVVSLRFYHIFLSFTFCKILYTFITFIGGFSSCYLFILCFDEPTYSFFLYLLEVYQTLGIKFLRSPRSFPHFFLGGGGWVGVMQVGT